MFPFWLPLPNYGLIITIVVFVLLYLIVLIKLKPSTEGKGTRKADSPKQKVPEILPTQRRSKPPVHNKPQGEAVNTPEPVPPTPIETEKTETTQETPIPECAHFFGYLSEHPKNTPIPNECLTCIRIMECLLGRE